MGIWFVPCGCVFSAAWTHVSTASVCELSTRHYLRLSWTGWQLAVQTLQTNAGFSSEMSHFQQPYLTLTEDDNSAVAKQKHMNSGAWNNLRSWYICPCMESFICLSLRWSMLDILAFTQSHLLCHCQLWHLLNQGLESMVLWKVFTVHYKLTMNLACYRTREIVCVMLSPRTEWKEFILGGHKGELNWIYKHKSIIFTVQ